MAKISTLEWNVVAAKVQECVNKYNIEKLDRAFLYLVLEQLFPDRPGGYADMITDGSNDRGVDAIEIIESDSSPTAEVYLIQSKYRIGIESTTRGFSDSDILKMVRFLEDLFAGISNPSLQGNVALEAAVERIWELHRRAVFCRYKIVFCSNDQGVHGPTRGVLENALSQHEAVSFQAYGVKDIIRDLQNSTRRNESGFLTVVGREIFERGDGDIRGVVASIDCLSFVDLISAGPDFYPKRGIFDDNLREYLGASGGYNKSIIDTGLSEDAHLFWYLNNGITIACTDFAYNKGHANCKLRLENFQIINGAQTSCSLLEVARLNHDKLSEITITVRVFATKRLDITERVAVATNSQARIQRRDLRANMDIMKKLELAFLSEGYYFERKKTTSSAHPHEKSIDALRLGQIIISYIHGRPESAKSESDQIFGAHFDGTFNELLDVKQLCSLHDLFVIIESRRDIAANLPKARWYSPYDDHLIYGQYFALYVISLLARDCGRDFFINGANEAINKALEIIVRALSIGRHVSHYQAFRSPKTREKIMLELSGAQPTLFDLVGMT